MTRNIGTRFPLFTLAVVGLGALIALGCGSGDDEAFANHQAQYRVEIENQIDRLETEISNLRSQAATASAEAEMHVEESIDELEEARDNLRDKLNELSQQTEETWDDWTHEVDLMMDEARRDLSASLDTH